MSDAYARVRSLPFECLAGVLGIDLSKFHHRGGEWHGPCPIHGSKKNSNAFHYNAATGKFHCFSPECNAKGSGGIDLAMKVRSIGFQAAVELLSPVEPVLSPPKEKSLNGEANSASGEMRPFKGSYHKFQAPCPWLESRVPDKAIRERYGLFMYHNPARKSAYDGRVMIPIRDIDGVLYGYLARDISEKPEVKYIWPKGLAKTPFLFGAYELKASGVPLPVKVLYVVESCWTVMKFAALNIPAVGLNGWSASEEQISTLATLAKGTVYLPDRNKASDCANVVQRLAQHLWVRFPPLPDGTDDPEYLTREQILDL